MRRRHALEAASCALVVQAALLAACSSGPQPSPSRSPAPAREPAPPVAGEDRRPEAASVDLGERRPAPTMGIAGADWLVRPEREAEEDTEAMLDALRLSPGDDVADIGAGVGYHSLRIARRVAPGGTVYATDLQPAMLARLRERAAEAGVDNVAAVRASQTETGLPDGAIELALMVDVYHELSDPGAVLTDLARALDPEDGRLALVEFRAEDPEVPIREGHKMSAAQMLRELESAGWTLDRRFDELPWQHLMIFAPPS